jgi:Polyketide cyclase / dehydrase and lipid transport
MTVDVKVEVRRSGRRFEAEVVLDLAADPQTVWDTITDYDGLPSFMPGIHACRVIERQTISKEAEHLVVEQHGEFRFMLFAQAMTVRLNIDHRQQRVAEARAVSFDLGPFKRRAIDIFEGRYDLAPKTPPGSLPRTQLRYAAVIALRLSPPPAVGTIAVRQNLVAQLRAVAQEVARRGSRSTSASTGC